MARRARAKSCEGGVLEEERRPSSEGFDIAELKETKALLDELNR
jgi:hypothetical protein